MNLSITTKVKGALSALRMDAAILLKIGRIVEGNVIDNIAHQTQASGAPLKQNARSTAIRKREKGWLWNGRVMALVAQMHRFVRPMGGSWRVIVGNNSVSVKPATGEIAQLSRFVQEKGYTGWFAVSNAGRNAIKLALADWVHEQLRRPRGSAGAGRAA